MPTTDLPTTDLPTYELPMRAADIDILHHVNNIVYVDYAAEARALMARDGLLDETRTIRGLDVRFIQPLQLSRKPVIVTNAWHGDVLVQEIRAERSGQTTSFARLETTFGDLLADVPRGGHARQYPARVRRVDMGEDGVSTLSKVFELFQEARTLYVSDLLANLASNDFVIAQVAVELGAGITWQPDGYASQSWMTRVGTSSAVVETEIVNGSVVHARATTAIVGFDAGTQSSRRITDGERAALSSALMPT